MVICGHVGFDGLRGVGDIWRGQLAGTTIRVKFWRYPAAEIPADEQGRVDWLYERWQILDDWIGEQLGDREPGPAALEAP